VVLEGRRPSDLSQRAFVLRAGVKECLAMDGQGVMGLCPTAINNDGQLEDGQRTHGHGRLFRWHSPYRSFAEVADGTGKQSTMPDGFTVGRPVVRR